MTFLATCSATVLTTICIKIFVAGELVGQETRQFLSHQKQFWGNPSWWWGSQQLPQPQQPIEPLHGPFPTNFGGRNANPAMSPVSRLGSNFYHCGGRQSIGSGSDVRFSTNPGTNESVTNRLSVFSLTKSHYKVSKGIGVQNISNFPWLAKVRVLLNKTEVMRGDGKIVFYYGYCTATIVSRTYLLTAAHCFNKLSNEQNFVEISVGSSRAQQDESERWQRGTPIIHPNHISDQTSEQFFRNARQSIRTKDDIALIKLERPLNFDSDVQPICLLSTPMFNEENGTKTGIVAGWGQVTGDSDVDQCEFGSALPDDEDLFSAKGDSLIKKAFIKRTSDATSRVWMEKDGTTGNGDKLSLHYGVVDTENADDCAAIRQPIFVNCAHGAPCAKDMNSYNLDALHNSWESEICLRRSKQFAGTEQGDSGGPLMAEVNGLFMGQAGIITEGTCLIHYISKPMRVLSATPMDVYTNVSYYCQWIAEVTASEVRCV